VTSRRSKQRPRIVGVIASPADLHRALRVRRPPDLFELRLDRLVRMDDQLKRLLPKLPAPLIITARHPKEGGAGRLSLSQRRKLLARFLGHADYLDVELRSASVLRSLLALAKKKKVRRIISFHNFKSTPSARLLAAKAREAKSHGADIFKIATRTDTPMQLGRLLDFITKNRVDVPLPLMGSGRLAAIPPALRARVGSALIYASAAALTSGECLLTL